MAKTDKSSFLSFMRRHLNPIKKICTASLLAFLLLHTQQAAAHPHVFADARLEVSINSNNEVEKLAHIWRFDEFFSSTVLMEFDKNGDLLLSEDELNTLAQTIQASLADFNYFQTIQYNNEDVTMVKPSHFLADFQDNQLLVIFETKPETSMALKSGHKASFGIYDPTFYTAIDFNTDSDLQIHGLPAGCETSIIRPDPDEALRQNQATLTEAFFNDPMGTNMSKIFATRLEIDCATRQ